jgi:N-acetylglucosaminyldiphosphoundecaprenol N-acetyl-beta-D-mannosaminyltransferase
MLQVCRFVTEIRGSMVDQGKHSILGVLVSAVDYETTVAAVAEAALARRGMAVSATAVHGIMTGCLDQHHKHRLNSLECFGNVSKAAVAP